MKKTINIFPFIVLLFVIVVIGCQQKEKQTSESELSTVDETKPWVFWYWMHGAITKEALTADLEAMKEVGLGGAYFFAIKDVTEPPLFEPSVRTLTPEWWQLVKHAMEEADRLELKLGMNICDGFTCAGGPWITPEMSMQKIVWADTVISGNQLFSDKLPQPEKVVDYYEDIATFAYPVVDGAGESSYNYKPIVTTSVKGKDLQFLAEKENEKQFSTGKPCWIQYEFENPFTCRSITVKTGWNNYQSNRLIIETSNDGINFKKHTRLVPPRSGWEDLDADATHTIEPITARYFRFVYDPEGSEPGAEDLDDAKWNPYLRTKGFELCGEAKIQQFEGKSGAIWRISKHTNDQLLPPSVCIAKDKLINISQYLQADGQLKWDIPEGDWIILRMGHTSTGHVNYIGGGGKGLECDKLNPEAVKIHFDHWFGEAFNQVGEDLAGRVLKYFHVDSWECGSQNWSPVFCDEFIKRRGYDLIPYLPVMAGVPLQDSKFSERVLSDIRETLSELVADNFYNVLAELAHDKDCRFSAESVAPVMVTDGMLHFREVDIPMGEFWLRSPSHDKLNDMLDAISGAHVYGKNIIQSESLTEIRLDWDEYPGMLKPVVDRNFALGINRMFMHVFTLNPWMDRKPGMTLDKVGTYFQRDQTWWKPGRAFVSYLTNCQRVLQQGTPVVDIAVFTGEEVPRRAILPDRLVNILPGIVGEDRVITERARLKNKGIPIRKLPIGVTTQEQMADPEEWIDPLNGYAYDSFNKDALLSLAKVDNGKIILPGGASYSILVVPGNRKMTPHGGEQMSVEVAKKLLSLAKDGATILMMAKPQHTVGLEVDLETDASLKKLIDELFRGEREMLSDENGNQLVTWRKGKGRIIRGPYLLNNFNQLGIEKDFQAFDKNGMQAQMIAWNHRIEEGTDIYFVANQENKERFLELSFDVQNKIPEFYNAVTNEKLDVKQWFSENGRIKFSYQFNPNESLFVLFNEGESNNKTANIKNWVETTPIQSLTGSWSVNFDPSLGGPESPVLFTELSDWSKNSDDRIRYYSGTAVYSKTFEFNRDLRIGEQFWIEFEDLANIAEITLNGKNCGVVWTPPYRLRIDATLQQGENTLEIAVTNTWANRLKRDHELPEEERITWTTAPYRLDGRSLLPAGLLGSVEISKTK